MKFSNITINYLSLYFIIPFSSFYITKLPLSPIYFFVMVGIFFSLLLLLITGKLKFDKAVLLSSLLLLYFASTQIVFLNPNISAYVNFNFSLVVFLVVYIMLYKISFQAIIKLGEKLVFFSIPLLIYEAYYRISNPISAAIYIEKGREDLIFYIYKINSIMFPDSNFVGLLIISLFFFLLYIKQHTNKKYLVSFCLLFILTLTTISRASIITLLLFLLLYHFRYFFYRNKKLIFIFLSIFSILLFQYLLGMKNIDDSFSTKFGIIDRTISYFFNTTITNQLFGVGFGNAVDVLGIGAHNFFVTYLVESGLIGLLLLINFWSYILYKTKFKAGIVMFPFLLNGMSVASGAIPYLYVMYAIILVVELKRIRFV